MKLKNITFVSIALTITSMFFLASPVFAHVIVYPHQAGIAATQDFTVSVPNERDTAVVAVRLLIPKDVSAVVPNATQGWTITSKSKGSGDTAIVTEIDWNNGTIPVGQREEFVFQAQVPPKPTTIDWKAYQTYADGAIVAWDVDPAKMSNLSDAQQDALADKENRGEYSTTQVINDLVTPSSAEQQGVPTAQTAMTLSIAALALSIIAFTTSLRRKNTS